MKAEERAHQLAGRLEALNDESRRYWQGQISQAIREAEDAAYERCAQICEVKVARTAGEIRLVQDIVQAIRARGE